MNRLLYFMPSGKSFIYIPDSNTSSEPITKEDVNLLLGIFIVVNTFVAALWLIELVRYLIYKKNTKGQKGWFVYFEPMELTEICSVIVGISWVLLIVVYLGYLVSKMI